MESIYKYDSMILLQPEATEKTKQKIINNVKKIAQVEEIEDLGIKKLAYKVKGYEYGAYLFFKIISNKPINKKIDQYYRTEKDILKFIIVRYMD